MVLLLLLNIFNYLCCITYQVVTVYFQLPPSCANLRLLSDNSAYKNGPINAFFVQLSRFLFDAMSTLSFEKPHRVQSFCLSL